MPRFSLIGARVDLCCISVSYGMAYSGWCSRCCGEGLTAAHSLQNWPSGRACCNQITGAKMTMYSQGYRLQGKGACSTIFSLQEYPFSHLLASKRSSVLSLFWLLKHCCSHNLFGFHPYSLDLVCLQCVLFLSIFCSCLSIILPLSLILRITRS